MSWSHRDSDSDSGSDTEVESPRIPAFLRFHPIEFALSGHLASLGINLTSEIRNVSARPLKFGGSASVYQGTWDSKYGTMLVALKVLYLKDQRTLKHFRHEISVWQALRHHNIHLMCGLYDGFGSVPAMVSPWYKSGDINTYLSGSPDNPATDRIKLSLLAQVINGLEFLHSKRIVHGDIKGGNVLVSDDGIPRLSDFGLSKFLYQQSPPTIHGQNSVNSSTGAPLSQNTYIQGTCRWMAPELFGESPRHTFASDIWAYGCLLIEVISGGLPYYTKENDIQVILALSNNERPARPAAISSIMYLLALRCCKIEAEDRQPLKDTLSQLTAVMMVTKVMIALSKLTPDTKSLFGMESLPSHRPECPDNYLRCDCDMWKWKDTQAYVRELEVDLWKSIDTLSATFKDGTLCSPPVPRTTPTGNACTVEEFLQIVITPAVRYTKPMNFVALLAGAEARLSFSADNTICVWELSTRTGDPILLSRGRIWSSTVWGRRAASAINDIPPIWRQSYTGTAVYLDSHFIAHNGFCVHSVAFSSDGRRIATAGGDCRITVRDVEQQVMTQEMLGHSGPVLSVAFSNDGTRVISGALDGTVRIWSAASGACIGEPLTGHGPGSCVTAVLFGAGDKLAYSASDDGTIRIWDAETRTLSVEPLIADGPVLSMILSPDARQLVSGSRSGCITMWDHWDAATGAPVRIRFMDHLGPIWSLMFSPDGHKLASALGKNFVAIWDVRRCKDDCVDWSTDN